jgi:hypothetical protein
VDGALGANNPINTLWNQAQDVWGDQLWGRLRCLVSIRTGVPALTPVRDDVLGIWSTLRELATETERQLNSSAAINRASTMKDAMSASMSTGGWRTLGLKNR